MSTIKTGVLLDRRSRTKRGYPLKLYGNVGGEKFYIGLGIYLEPDQWDAESRVVVRHPKAAPLNRKLTFLLSQTEDVVLGMQLGTPLSSSDVRSALVASLGLGKAETPPPERKREEGAFAGRWRAFTATRATEGTRDFYDRTWRLMAAFDPSLPLLSFEDIDKDWLTRFDKWMSSSNGVNSRAIHFRNIRAVFNDALDDEVTNAYPFRKFRIRTESTRHRNLSVEELRALINAPQTSGNLRNEREYIDLFLLSFFLIGINLVDMRDMEIVKGRAEYRRAKTHKLYDIKVEPEAMEIIRRYSGGKHVINIFDRFADYNQLTRQINRGLSSVGRPTGKQGRVLGDGPFKGLTYYWARHTWASIASEIDIPRDVIAHALGHGQRTVTDIYINFDGKKVDEANRKVIDYVMYGKDWRKSGE